MTLHFQPPPPGVAALAHLVLLVLAQGNLVVMELGHVLTTIEHTHFPFSFC